MGHLLLSLDAEAPAARLEARPGHARAAASTRASERTQVAEGVWLTMSVTEPLARAADAPAPGIYVPARTSARACDLGESSGAHGEEYSARLARALTPSKQEAAASTVSLPPRLRVAAVALAPAQQAKRPILGSAAAAVKLARGVGERARADGGGDAPLLALRAPDDGSDLADVHRLMAARAVQDMRCDDDGLGVKGASDEALEQMMMACQRAMERRFALGTRKLDRSYWRFWEEHCKLLGTPPLRTNAAANSGGNTALHRRELGVALSFFMTCCALNPQYKVESMLSRVRGVARRHKAVGLTFVSLSLVVMAAEGLIQEQIDVHGAEILLVKSKEPFTYAEVAAMFALTHGDAVIAGIVMGEGIDAQGVRVYMALFATMGPRGEAIALGERETYGGRKLRLGSVTYCFDGVLTKSPTLQQLRNVTAGDRLYITPCPCKNDPKGTKYGNAPVVSRWHPTRVVCLMRELVQYELMRRVPQEERAAAPLVLAPGGVPWTKKKLQALQKALNERVCAPARARRLTVHSWRVWLACALLAQGATPEQIMQLLRWSSDEARKLYARMAEGTQASMLEAAVEAPIDSIRSHTLYAEAAAQDAARAEARAAGPSQAGERVAQGGAALDEDASAVERAQDGSGELPDPGRLPDLDDDELHARLHAARDGLRAAASTSDAALVEADGDTEGSEDGY